MQISDRIHADVSGFDYTINLRGPIGPPEEYNDEINLLNSVQENDRVYIRLNTPGGDLDTAIQFLHAITACRGVVYGVGDGQVASAGSIIFFGCHAWIVGDFSYFMQHDGSSGYWGKISDNQARATADSKLLEKIYKKIYAPFFSEQEISDILRGVDLHLTSEEVIERLEKYEKEQSEKNDELNALIDKIEDTVENWENGVLGQDEEFVEAVKVTEDLSSAARKSLDQDNDIEVDALGHYEFKVGDKVMINEDVFSFEEYPSGVRNPTNTTGEVTRIYECPINISWSNGYSNAYKPEWLILVESAEGEE